MSTKDEGRRGARTRRPRSLDPTRPPGNRYIAILVLVCCLVPAAIAAAQPPRRPALAPDELVEAIAQGSLLRPARRLGARIIGATRLAPEPGYLEIADRECEQWSSIPLARVLVAHPVAAPSVRCDGAEYPVLGLTLGDAGDLPPPGSRAPAVTFLRISNVLRVPRLVIGGGVLADWDDCLDRYLDCQIDCNASDGGIFGSLDACLDHCEAVFDACTWDPF